MEEFKVIRTLVTRPKFTILEANSKKFKMPVLVKKCVYSREAEAEFFIRSTLIKTKDKVYSQPPLSIFAYSETATRKTFIVLVWKKCEPMDRELERDQGVELQSGNAGFEKREVIHMNSGTGESIERAKCVSLHKNVVIKVFKHAEIMECNSTFHEALTLAKCTHPNICEFLDFRLFRAENGGCCAYIVMEQLDEDLLSEIRNRKSMGHFYTETELINIIKDVVEGLAYAKSLNVAHRDIKPSNILRSAEGLKIADFGSTWQQGQCSETASTSGTIPYMSPEAWASMSNSESLQRPFESDVFALGITILHLATLEMPQRTSVPHEQEELFRRSVGSLNCCEELKQLITAMLTIDMRRRPTIEFIRERMSSMHPQAEVRQRPPIPSKPTDRSPSKEESQSDKALRDTVEKLSISASELEASQLLLQSIKKLRDKKYAEAAEASAAADVIFTRVAPEGQKTAYNRKIWATALRNMGNQGEALNKYVAADSIYSRLFPDDKETADNFNDWALALKNVKKYAEAVQKFAAADAIYSRLFPNDKNTANNFYFWGGLLRAMGKPAEAVAKYAAADAIYTRLNAEKDVAENQSDWGMALLELGKNAEAVQKFSAVDAAYSRLFPNDQRTAHNLYYWGVTLKKMEKCAEAVTKFAAADAIYTQLHSDKDIAENLSEWGVALRSLNNLEEAVIKFAAADAIFSRQFPSEKATANNLYCWAITLKMTKKLFEAIEKFGAANAIYSRHFPNDKYTGDNLWSWGGLLKDMGNNAEAVIKYAAAGAVYSRLNIESDIAENLSDWGIALNNMGRNAEAAEKFAEACAIYTRLAPSGKITANTFYFWGSALKDMKNYAEAATKYASAEAIYSRKFPDDKMTANNYYYWGIALKNMGNNAESEQKFKSADAIYSRRFPGEKSTANNLWSWGLTLKALGQKKEAIRKIKAAADIYNANGMKEDYRDCNRELASLW